MASFKSVLSEVGADVKKVFAWIGSAQGQTILATGEGVVETVLPQADGLISLGNSILAEAIKVEALGAAAGAAAGSGSVQKLTAVTSAVTPQVLAYAKSAGLPTPTATQIQNAVNALVAFGNAFTA